MAQEQGRGPTRAAPDGFAIRVAARAEELRTVRHALDGWLEGQGARPEVGAEIALAVHEAAANSVEHAYPGGAGDLIVQGGHRGGEVVVVVEDRGRWRPPSRADQRGRGLTLMHRLMDDVQITPGPNGTQVTLRRRIERG